MDKYIKNILTIILSITLAAFLYVVYNTITPLIDNSFKSFIYTNLWFVKLAILIVGNIIIFLFYFIIAPHLVDYFSNKSIKYPDNYENLYKQLHNIYYPILKKLQNKILLKEASKTSLIFSAFLSYLMLGSDVIFTLLSLGIVLIIFGIVYFATKSASLEYVEIYKTKIISSMVQSLNSNFKYIQTVPDQQVAKNLYDQSKLFVPYYDSLFADDYIKSYIGNNIPIQIFNIITKRLIYSTRKRIGFNGLLIIADIDCNTSNGIIVTRRSLPYEESYIFVQTTNQEFENNFAIFSDNKIFATYIFTPDILNFINDFYKLYKLDFEFSFHDKKMYFKFNTGDTFEPNIIGNPINKLSLYTYYYTLDFIIEFVKKISNIMNSLGN